jgi:uncharacterized protein (TIGR03067 family)
MTNPRLLVATLLLLAGACAVLLVIFGGNSATTTNPRPDSPSLTSPTLEGSWELVSVNTGGVFVKTVYTMRDGEFTVQGSLPERGTYKVDAGHDPAHLDMFPDEGPFQGKHWQWIYRIDGDTLRMASTRTGDERPSRFEGEEGLIVLTLWRVK